MAFTAQYNGWCSDCSEPIYPGQQVEYVDGALVHTEHDVQRRPAVVCPVCHLTKPCDCEED